ncbi:hypothetical protein [Gloeocapsopsis dulcis]|uniref:Uncharacterized protein n=1 Tax=Gloeocapsopsis dulcis AAB1 = 1H9 TaxID=1433147 RepID=A0A6N8FRG3_9CHRO|nr:hypothetical protein [Gloeocapsopsis dulcis]MUL34935.1 hypothetical protein [Gloeocapsopsis dulcis AAB1 = 1H9]WNN89993.1 hypothetical protein P0S91_02525 [Gloeocapsopsis dulcis]
MAPIKLKCTFNAQADKGPKSDFTQDIEVEDTDQAGFSIKVGQTREIELQASDDNRNISFLLIKPNWSNPENLIYSASADGQTWSSEVTLDKPHVYLGTGLISLLGVIPKRLKFTYNPPAPAAQAKKPEPTTSAQANKPDSTNDEPKRIEILVGRSVFTDTSAQCKPSMSMSK